ncbi:hypothetical protein BK658_15065 [Pseudomonas brassicacearum]|uniref:Uncharacterized protein n=1 Tax=Pseudomonas brassicacearum TaxID=930166 RepID=A0A423GRB0_9PSED|nr:hypothetical protein BK658_15065 [Pseudomonas brassicacearum]
MLGVEGRLDQRPGGLFERAVFADEVFVSSQSIASTVPYMPLEKMAELIPLIKRVTARLSAQLGARV